MSHQLKILEVQQMLHIGFLTGKKIVQANDVMPLLYQAFAQMGTQESSTASN
jgi:hypothetical protein